MKFFSNETSFIAIPASAPIKALLVGDHSHCCLVANRKCVSKTMPLLVSAPTTKPFAPGTGATPSFVGSGSVEAA